MDTMGFEVFIITEVLKDISKHVMVPTHILLNKENAQKVISDYKLKKQDMKRILEDDPMVRFLYAHKDEIIEIRRTSIISGGSTDYRLVVAGSISN